MKRVLTKTVATLAVLASAATVLAQNDNAADFTGRKLNATTLNGSSERPDLGDPNGTGSFSARVNPGRGEICYELKVDFIATAAAAHIHRGVAGVAGGVVVPLVAPANGSSSACRAITRELAMELIQTPENFYVNVHNAEFPGGAVRGQLTK